MTDTPLTPSDAERAEWPDNTRCYVEWLESQDVPNRSSFDILIADARIEAVKAMRKFPQPNYVISKIAEESGEVVKAAIHYAENRETPENVAGEMKQLIAMLYRLWIEGDEVHGMKPVCAFARMSQEAPNDN